MFLTSDPDEHPSYCRCNECDTAYRGRIYELYSGMLGGGAQCDPPFLWWASDDCFRVDADGVAYVSLFDTLYFVP